MKARVAEAKARVAGDGESRLGQLIDDDFHAAA